MVRNQDDTNRAELHHHTFKVLRPQIEKILSVMAFTTHLAKEFCKQVASLCTGHQINNLVPEGFHMVLIRTIDLLFKIDSLKDMKVCSPSSPHHHIIELA